MPHETLDHPSAGTPPLEDRAPPFPPSGDGVFPDCSGPSLSRNSSSSRLNAQAPEFVPRTPPTAHTAHTPGRMEPRMVPIHHRGPPPPPPPVVHVFHRQPPPAFHHVPVVQNQFEFYGGGGAGYREHDVVHHAPPDADSASAPTPAGRDALPEDVIQKVINQVEYYFSDINLATTEHLMRVISKDPDGFVPISVIAAFKKIKAVVSNNTQLATALRTSSKLLVSDDGKKVKRQQPFTEVDLEELQSRIVVAENLPEDHCYQNLMKVFSVVGNVKTIRTCYPQTTNGMASATSKLGKMDIFLGNKLHAFVEYETVEEAEKAVAELNDEKNWRSGLRVRLLPRCMTKFGQNRGRKVGNEGEGAADEEDASTSNQHHEKHFEDPSQPNEASHEHTGDDGYHDKEGGARRGRGRGRGTRGRGRGGHFNNNQRNGGHAAPGQGPGHPAPVEQLKQPPGPRMPDGTRGFTMGRGKPLDATGKVVS